MPQEWMYNIIKGNKNILSSYNIGPNGPIRSAFKVTNHMVRYIEPLDAVYAVVFVRLTLLSMTPIRNHMP